MDIVVTVFHWRQPNYASPKACAASRARNLAVSWKLVSVSISLAPRNTNSSWNGNPTTCTLTGKPTLAASWCWGSNAQTLHAGIRHRSIDGMDHLVSRSRLRLAARREHHQPNKYLCCTSLAGSLRHTSWCSEIVLGNESDGAAGSRKVEPVPYEGRAASGIHVSADPKPEGRRHEARGDQQIEVQLLPSLQ